MPSMIRSGVCSNNAALLASPWSTTLSGNRKTDPSTLTTIVTARILLLCGKTGLETQLRSVATR